MPELPEVETVVRALRDPLIGRTFIGFESYWPNQIVVPDDVDQLRSRIDKRTVTAVNRRAKYIVITLDGGEETLIVHLKMTGHLAVVPSKRPIHKHVRNLFKLKDGFDLRFRDMRKFGRIYLVKNPLDILAKLGPEPLEDAFTAELFQQRIAGRTRIIKPLLLDQTIVAGIGNIYADETLFDAKVRPDRSADSLTEAEIHLIWKGIRRALQEGIDREGASIDSYIKPDGTKGDMQNAVNVYGRTAAPCYDCGQPIERIVLAQRSTHFCPHCQK
ncbi:MAG: bifunctional DNA-formamidopyrimidine glycosylase/DNA-(apurinic or apyrimidinic site) lyase [Anaerolineae bacterium]